MMPLGGGKLSVLVFVFDTVGTYYGVVCRDVT
jgi:hypothetical protein